MNRAVRARIMDPSLALSQALFVGGFRYPSTDDASAVDDELVTLGQRKNQLLRRLRERARRSSSSSNPMKSAAAKNKVPSLKQQQQQQQPPMVSLSMREDSMHFPDPLMSAQRHQQQVATLLPPPQASAMTNNQPGCLLPVSGQASLINDKVFEASLFGALVDSSLSGTVRTSNYPFQDNRSTASMAPVSAATDSSTIASTSTTLSSTSTSACTTNSTTTSTNGDEVPQREDMALQFFEAAVQDLYKECMRYAGYPADQIEDNSPSCRRFAFLAWQQECFRLQQIMSRDDISPSDPNFSMTDSMYPEANNNEGIFKWGNGNCRGGS